MPDEFSPIYHQVDAIQLVGEFMLREDLGSRMRNRRTPVLVLTGPRGTGKTALLNQVSGALDDIPYAYVDCAKPVENTRDILLLIAFSLSRQSTRYGELLFPRLITGALVISAELDLGTDRNAARKKIGDLLTKQRKGPGVLDDAVGVLVKVVGRLVAAGADRVGASWVGTDLAMGDVAEKYAAESARRVLGVSRRGRRLLLGDGQEWYGDQDQGLGAKPLDKLVDLRAAADGAAKYAVEYKAEGDDATREVTRTLWAAFLADLRFAFGPRERAGRQTHNCVVLLDNADTAPGRTFLQELLTARQLRGDQESDPLTVVATSRGELTTRLTAGAATTLTETTLAHASYDAYWQRGGTGLVRYWYPVLLPPLSWTETRGIIDAIELPREDGPSLTTVIHAFTGGNRSATDILLSALSKHPRDTGPSGLSQPPKDPGNLVATLLAALADPDPRRSPAGDKRTAEEAMLKALTRPPLSAVEVDYLVACSAARNRAAAARLSANSGMIRQPSSEAPVIDAAEFWSSAAVGRSALLHPLLRRLLLRKLARRDAATPANWTAVHAWLVEDSEGDIDAHLYHTLALADENSPGPAETVVRQLLEKNTVPASRWLRQIARVTAAPNRLGHPLDPWEMVDHLTRWATGDRDLTAASRLVVSSWLGADPLRAPHWRQYLRWMASELEILAPRAGSGVTVLRDEAQRYRNIAEGSWLEVASFWAARTALATETSEGAN
jgi:hypothetical protein